MADFKPGDIVKLKSGGPRMTVEDIGQYDMGRSTEKTLCVWFDERKPMKQAYALVVLELAPPLQGARVLSEGVDG